MTSTDLAIRSQPSLPEKIEYARFLAKSGLLPPAYRQHPENILYAVEYGEVLGLHPMAAITGIHIIDGRPSIGAGLISALVRSAGHRIRVEGNGDKARCQIIRADDPGFTYTSVWDMDRAKQAGLLGKTNWQRYPAAMLKARAVSEAARDACQEVLLGIQYTPDELGADDDGGEVIHDGFPTAPGGQINLAEMTEEEKDAAGAMVRPQRVEHAALVRDVDELDQAKVSSTDEVDPDDPWASPSPADAKPQPATKRQTARLAELTGQLQLEDTTALFGWLCGAEWAGTRSQVQQAINWLEDHLDAAGGDVVAAATAMWGQYHEQNTPAE